MALDKPCYEVLQQICGMTAAKSAAKILTLVTSECVQANMQIKKRLSSKATLIYRVMLLPPTAIVVYRLLFYPHEKNWLALVIIACAYYFWGPLFLDLKAVSLDGRSLIVSNYWKTIRIDLSEVKSVTWSVGTRPGTITLRLRSTSEFGREIVFIPAGDVAAVGAELRGLTGTCSRTSPGEGAIGAAQVAFLRRYMNKMQRKKG